MSFMFPDVNVDQTNASALRLSMPTGAGNKPANTAFTVLSFIRTPSIFVGNFTRNILARNNGLTGGNDCNLGTNGLSGTLVCNLRDASVLLATTTGAANPITLLPNRNYMVGVIANTGGTWLFACEPGSAPTIQALLVTAPGAFASAFSGGGATGVFGNIGGAVGANPWFGPMEEVCMWHGAFPEVSSAPDPAVLQALASGTQPLDTFHTAVTPNLTRRFRYTMANSLDYVDAFGITAALTATNISVPATRCGYTSGPLHPDTLKPTFTRSMISQVIFGTVGNASTATTTIRTEGGTYTGITPAAIQARLLDDQTGEVLYGPIVVDAAPTGGSWAVNSNAFTNVLMRAGMMRVEFRAIDGGGAGISGWIPGYGGRGAGFCQITSGQSQLGYYFGNNSLTSLNTPLPSGAIGIAALQYGNINRPGGSGPIAVTPAPYNIEQYMIGSGSSAIRWRGGVRQLIIEINALYPGVPVQVLSVLQNGEPINAFYLPDPSPTLGAFALRWAGLKTNMGVLQPYYLGLMGHSSGSAGDYHTRLGTLVNYAKSELGRDPIATIHYEVPRYWNGPTVDSPIHEAQAGRHGQRRYCAENPIGNIWGGSWASVVSRSDANEAGVALPDVHPAENAEGVRRGGGMMAYAHMFACKAIEDVPLHISAVKAVGSTAVIEFGAVNP